MVRSLAMPPPKPAILVFGDINADIIGRVDAWPKPGEECLAPNLELHCGGVAANCAIALSRWSVHSNLIACAGQDPIGDSILQKLTANKIDIRHIQRTTQAMTGLLYINVTPDGQRTFFGSRGANRTVRLLPRDLGVVKRARAAILMGYSFLDSHPTQAATQIIRQLRANGGWIALDAGMEPSQKIPEKILQIAKRVDVLFVSQEEATALTGSHQANAAVRQLKKAGVHNIAVKLGKRGCLIAEDDAIREVPPFSVHAVDSTGAGDAFTAAFLQARLRNWSAAEAALAANAAGAAAATVVGAGEQAPSTRAIAQVLRSQRLPAPWNEIRQRVLSHMGQKP
jgi:ribokinase